MKNIIILIFTLLNILSLNGQNQFDALRYSQQSVLGNARFSSMSGAFGSLGAEFSSLSYNPAGIGLYQSNEFTFTPSFNVINIKSYSDTPIDFDRIHSNIASLGIVYTLPKNNQEWKRINIGFGINQLASYEKNIRIQVNNTSSSLVDNIIDLADGNTINNLNDFHTSLAFWTDLIDLSNNSIDTSLNPVWYLYDNGEYISHVKSQSNKTQSADINSRGSQHEGVLSIGGSYNEYIYTGITIGFPNIEYYERSTYGEDNFEDTINGLEGFNYDQELSVNGTGINIKAGIIIRASEQFKIGATIHSPTFYEIEEVYSTSMKTYFSNETYSEVSPYNIFKYNLITPWKGMLSGSTILNQNIIISADYEIVDYTFSEISSDDYLFSDENDAINNQFTRATNIRIGTEANLKPFIFRAGYSNYGSAIKNQEFGKENFSFGVGISNNRYFFDIAYVLSEGRDEHRLYSEDYISPIDLVETNHNLFFTLGFRY